MWFHGDLLACLAEDGEESQLTHMATTIWLLKKEICPRDNNKVVIYISLYHDKCLLFMLEFY